MKHPEPYSPLYPKAHHAWNRLRDVINAHPNPCTGEALAADIAACAVARLRKSKATREAVGNESRAMVYNWLADQLEAGS